MSLIEANHALDEIDLLDIRHSTRANNGQQRYELALIILGVFESASSSAAFSSTSLSSFRILYALPAVSHTSCLNRSLH